jgi:hypothetical protein
MIGRLLANDCRFQNITLSFWAKSIGVTYCGSRFIEKQKLYFL